MKGVEIIDIALVDPVNIFFRWWVPVRVNISQCLASVVCDGRAILIV